MTNQALSPKSKKVFDLGKRTARFGEDVIRLAKKLPESAVMRPLISQVVRSSTSVGANYMEADSAESRKDFRHKILLSKKESQETMHWLRMLAAAHPQSAEECRGLWKESHELTLIFAAIIRSLAKGST
jgi:four helix bundle protein